MEMMEKLRALDLHYADVEARLSAPETYEDPALVARLNKEQRELEPVVMAYRAYQRRRQDLEDAEALMGDPDMKELAQEEYQQAREELARLEEEIKVLLLPRDPNDDKNVIVEIRAGVGGEEAALFAHSLFRMYSMYAVDFELNPADIEMQVFRSSGAGGQHINKTSSAVRLIHKPTGIVVSSQQERSQFQNRDTCMKMLRSKLVELQMQAHAEKISDLKGVQMKIEWGSQIRSYVFMPYQLVKDTRTGYETSNVGGVMDGDLDGFINAYLKAEATGNWLEK